MLKCKSPSYSSPVLLWIILYTSFWTALYNVLCRLIFSREPTSYSARLVASVNALAVSRLFYFSWRKEPNTFFVLGSEVTEFQLDFLAAALGYILFDFVWCLTSESEPFIMKAHHCVCVVLIALVIARGVCGTEVIFMFGTHELTNLFLQLSWFLGRNGLRCRFTYGMVEFIFIVSFFTQKIWLTFLLFNGILKNSRVPLDIKVFLTAHCTIGFIFAYYVVQLLVHKYVFKWGGKRLLSTPVSKSLHCMLDEADVKDDSDVCHCD